MTLLDPTPEFKQTLPDKFEISRPSARFVIESSVEGGNPNVVARARQIHGLSYFNYEYFDKNGLSDDGSLVPELDGTRGTEDGRVVANYLVAREHGKQISEATATVRLLDIGANGTLEDLPTYKYFAGKFDDASRTKLENIVDLYGSQGVREVAALGTVDNLDHTSSYELMRALVQNSMIKQARFGQREVYLASLTPKSFRPVTTFIEPKTAEVLSEPVQIFSDDPRSKSIHVTPVLMDLSKSVDNILEAIEKEQDSFNIINLVQKLQFMTDGLDRDVMGTRVSAFLDKLS